MQRTKTLWMLAAVLTLLIPAGCLPAGSPFDMFRAGYNEDEETPYDQAYEALDWLENNDNPAALAGNRFIDTQEAIDFVQALYDAGAQQVVVTSIFDEQWRINADGGPYADTLVVELPADSAQREDILEIYRRECEEYECNFGDVESGISEGWAALWWD